MFHPPRTGLTRRLEQQAPSLKEVFQAPRLTPLALSVIRTIHESALKERKDVLGVVIKLKDCPSIKGQGGGNGIDLSKSSSAPAHLPTK